MALAKDYAFTMPSLREKVVGMEEMIDRELNVLRLKKNRTAVFLRMDISDSKTGDPELEKALRQAYESQGWRVHFQHGAFGVGTEIILHE